VSAPAVQDLFGLMEAERRRSQAMQEASLAKARRLALEQAQAAAAQQAELDARSARGSAWGQQRQAKGERGTAGSKVG